MMKNRWGRIIGITSVVGVTGNPGQANYAASKAGMIGFTKALAAEVASRNVTANCIAPGFIKTPMTDALNDKQRETILSKVPAARLGTPRGHRRRRGLPRLQRVRLRHRTDPACQRRHGHDLRRRPKPRHAAKRRFPALSGTYGQGF